MSSLRKIIAQPLKNYCINNIFLCKVMSHQRISTKLSSHWLMHGLSCKIFLARWERIIHIGCAVRHRACSAGSLQWSVWVQHRSPHTRIIFSLLLTKSGLHFTHWMRMLLGVVWLELEPSRPMQKYLSEVHIYSILIPHELGVFG